MNSILTALLKAIGTRRALEVILSVLRWIAAQTPAEWDNQIVEKLEQLYELLYPLVPAKKRR